MGIKGSASTRYRRGGSAAHARLATKARVQDRVGKAAGPPGVIGDASASTTREKIKRPRPEAPARPGISARAPPAVGGRGFLVSSGAAPSTRSSRSSRRMASSPSAAGSHARAARGTWDQRR